MIARATLAVLLVASSVAGAQSAPSVDASTPADRLSWMSGCWSRTNGATIVEEQWMSPRGGTLLGTGRTTVNGRTREYEFLRVFTAGDTLVYGSIPSGQTYAEFSAKSVGERDIVFENLQHDFPQRIGYRAVGTDSLVAFIEGPRGGSIRRIEFPYRRATCPTSPPQTRR